MVHSQVKATMRKKATEEEITLKSTTVVTALAVPTSFRPAPTPIMALERHSLQVSPFKARAIHHLKPLKMYAERRVLLQACISSLAIYFPMRTSRVHIKEMVQARPWRHVDILH